MPSQRVQSGLIGVMSGARDGNLDHQVRGEPESIAGSGGLPRQSGSLGSSGQRVSSPDAGLPWAQGLTQVACNAEAGGPGQQATCQCLLCECLM